MHPSSRTLMPELVGKLPRRPSRVLEIGSLDVNGSYRDLMCFQGLQWYLGMDFVEGKGVDVFVSPKTDWSQWWSSSMVGPDCPEDLPVLHPDLVMSGQQLEHDPDPFETARRMVVTVESGGHVIIIAPFKFVRHHPPDYWRFTDMGLEHLLTRVKSRAVTILDKGVQHPDPSTSDAWVVARVD